MSLCLVNRFLSKELYILYSYNMLICSGNTPTSDFLRRGGQLLKCVKNNVLESVCYLYSLSKVFPLKPLYWMSPWLCSQLNHFVNSFWGTPSFFPQYSYLFSILEGQLVYFIICVCIYHLTTFLLLLSSLKFHD